MRTSLAILIALVAMALPVPAAPPTHTFSIGKTDFLLDKKPFQIRCGEIHFARVPREYWRHRLQLCKAMGLNTVCAYLFWNFHEFEQGTFDWSGQADAAEFCRIAQEEGLWVILRPGPYSCAEWDMGGLPWWLLRNENIVLRSGDPDFMAASRKWLQEVGRVLGPLQITKGGPILMVQVENEYGFYGNDAQYMADLRKAVQEAGFDVPLFACNPAGTLGNGFLSDLFQVVNFGKNPEGGFRALRKFQPEGPLMCGEFYPGWFDTWGSPHKTGSIVPYINDLEYMLKNNASFSIYMAHGGSTFGLWAGADRPYKPDTSSYDYDAPISENGAIGEKFQKTRDLFRQYLLPGESLPEPPAPNLVAAIPPFELTESSSVFANLTESPVTDIVPRFLEAYNQGHGCSLYRTTVPAGPAARLDVQQISDFAWVFLDGKQIGSLDRRNRPFQIPVPARSAPARLDIFVETMGHVNFGKELHDRKGLHSPVRLVAPNQPPLELQNWEIHPFKLDAPLLARLNFQPGRTTGPAFWRGSFEVAQPQDTFLDLRSWGKGVLWVNGHCLGRFWNIGPTQTMYLPGPWLKAGKNEVIVLDLLGPTSPTLAGMTVAILDQLRPERDFSPKTPFLSSVFTPNAPPVFEGSFPQGPEPQKVMLATPVKGRQFCLESLDAHNKSRDAAIAELDILDANGQSLPHGAWSIIHADSQETAAEDGGVLNAIDGQTANHWISGHSGTKPSHPHRIVIDFGKSETVGGFLYTPRPGDDKTPGRIQNYKIFIGDTLAKP